MAAMSAAEASRPMVPGKPHSTQGDGEGTATELASTVGVHDGASGGSGGDGAAQRVACQV